MDFEEPNPPRHAAGGGNRRGRDGEDGADRHGIPHLPAPVPQLTGDEVRRGVSNRNRAAMKLKSRGFSYLEIAEELDFPTAMDAKRAVESVIAATLTPEEIDMQRALVVSRAEELYKQSIAMATADYLVDDDGERVANDKKLQWHQQASSDLMNIATLTGAKAPTKVEFTPTEVDLERMVERMVQLSGHEDIVDAEVIEWDAIPAIERTPEEGGDA
jgi:hypothetical protein